MNMSTLPNVDGQLMVRTLSMMEAPHFEVPDIAYLSQQIEDIQNQGSELVSAGFLAQEQVNRLETVPELRRKLDHARKLESIQDWRNQGFFVINVPEWTGVEMVDGVSVNYKLTSRTSMRNAMRGNLDFQALYSVGIQNWIGDIPSAVIEASKEFGHMLYDMSIMFVAKRSILPTLVRNFVNEDPVLVGRIPSSPDHCVILKMWGDDLEELSLELLDESSVKLNKWR